MARKVGGLGKGLEALFQDNSTEDGAVTTLKISQIEPNRQQPRVQFDDGALRELADSIRAHGVIQPLVVRTLEQGGYQIVAGERRWRACRMAGVTDVPVIIRELDDIQTLEIAIIENLQREDLNIMELANGYRTLMDQYGMTQEQVADKLGKSRPVIANTVRLLSLPEAVQDDIAGGRISQGHAKALLGLEDPELIAQVAGRVVKEKLLVRDIERMAKARKEGTLQPAGSKAAPSPAKQPVPVPNAWGDSTFLEVALALTEQLGHKVRISRTERGSYELKIEVYEPNDLLDLAESIGRGI